MKSLFMIPFNTKLGLELLDNEFEDDLNRKSITIIVVLSLVDFMINFKQRTVDVEGDVLKILTIIMSICFSVFFATLIAYILYKIGSWLKGKANYIEILSLLVYAYFYSSLGVLITHALRRSEYLVNTFNNAHTRNTILFFFAFIGFKILFKGVLKFNKFSVKNTVINIMPIFVFQILILGVYLLYF